MKIATHVRVSRRWYHTDDTGRALGSCNVTLVVSGRPHVMMGTWDAQITGDVPERDDFKWAITHGIAMALELHLPLVVESPLGRREVAFGDPAHALSVDVTDAQPESEA